MKTARYLFFCVMACMLTLSLLSKNNLNPGGINVFGTVESDTISREKATAFITESLIVPMKKCYAEAHPHVFMTKCYSDLVFKFTARENWGMTSSPIRKDDSFSGQVLFEDCGRIEFVCSVKAVYARKEILVRSSFFDDYIESKKYLNSWCEKINDTSEEMD